MAGIYKRGGVWWGRVQRKGREYRQSLRTPSRDVAKRRMLDWVNRMDALAWGDEVPRLYKDAMYHFLTGHVPILKPSSQRRYETSARKLTVAFRDKFLHEITNGRMSEYVTARRAEGAKSPTIRRDLACLSSMFETVIVDWDLEILNPVPPFLKKQRRRGLKESPPRTRYLFHDEETDLIKHAADHRKYLVPIIQVAIDTGLRLEELASLTWAHVNLKRKEITAIGTKNHENRVVPILERSAQILAHLPRTIRKPNYVFFHKTDGSRYIRFNKGLGGAAKRAGIPDLKWHDLRRTCGCRLLQDYEMPIEQVSRWLGHKSIAQTERAYAFLEVDQLHATISVGTKTGTGRADSES